VAEPPCALPCLAPMGSHGARRAVWPVSGRLFRVRLGSFRRPWCAALAGRGRLRTQEEPCALQSAAGASRERPHAAGGAQPRSDPPHPSSARSKPPPRLVHARPVSPMMVPPPRHDLRCLPPQQPRTWIPQRRSPSMNPFDLRRPRFRDVSDQEPLGMDLPPSPGGLSRARTDGITGFAARGFNALENGIHRRPAREVRAGVIGVRRAGRVALGARTGTVNCQSPWPHLRAGGRLASGGRRSRRTARPQQPDRALPKSGATAWPQAPPWSGARRQILRAPGRPEGPQSWNSFQGAVGLQWSTVCDQASPGGRVKGSTWNRADGPCPEQPSAGLSPRPSGTRARDFQTGPAPRSMWNSRHAWARSPSGQSAE
jgi:hypothetical protein